MAKKNKRQTSSQKWVTVLSGSLIFTSAQAAQAAQDDRPSFREFREMNQGVARNCLRKLYREQYNGRRSDDINIIPVFPKTSTEVRANAAVDVSNRPNIRQNRYERRLERGLLPKQSAQENNPGRMQRLIAGVNLDLTSDCRNITLGSNLFANVGSVQINVGGETRTIAPGAKVTAAEYVAVRQVIATSQQDLTIDSRGRANGGSVNLSSLTTGDSVIRASNLTVPVDVTATGDFARKRSDFRLLGDLNNFGTINALATTGKLKAGIIHADDITNHSTGTINSSVNLILAAEDCFLNLGTINSEKGLTLAAGTRLTNRSQLNVDKNITLTSSNIVNTGTASSLRGNINFEGPPAFKMTVNNTGGTISALNGDINVRGRKFNAAANTSVSGGNMLSQQFNVNSGKGIATVNVNQLTGKVSTKGSEVHIQAATEVLALGKICLTGDPTFKNSEGSILITGDISVAEDLSIIARDNIKSVDNIRISAANDEQGFDITLLAGAAQEGGAGDDSTAGGDSIGVATTVIGASENGGSVMLGKNVTINSRANTVAGNLLAQNGGNVFIAANAGRDTTSGVVDLSGTSILTGGRGANAINGAVTLVAGSESRAALLLGDVDTTGGNTTSGSINAMTADIVSTNGQAVSFGSNGKISSGNAFTFASELNRGGIVGSGNLNSNSALNLGAGGALGLSGNMTTSQALTLTGSSLGNGSITGSINAGELRLNSNGNIGSDNNAFVVDSGVETFSVNAAGDVYIVAGVPSVTPGRISTKRVAPAEAIRVGASTVGKSFNLTSLGAMSIEGDMTSLTGELNLNSFGGMMVVQKDVALNAETELNIVNSGTNRRRDFIVFSQGTTIATHADTPGFGDVNISLGGTREPNRRGTPNKFTIVEHGGTVNFSGRRVGTAMPMNFLTAEGADININNGNRLRSIMFAGDVSVTADPPVAPGTPTFIRVGNSGSQFENLSFGSTNLLSQSQSTANNMQSSGMQMLFGNVQVNDGIMGNANNLDLLGSSAVNAPLDDDSMIAVNSPSGNSISAKFCSDLDLTLDASNLETIVHSAKIKLDRGAALFAPATDTLVVTPQGTVKVGANAIALVFVDRNQLSVYDVNDQRKSSVVVDLNGRSIALSPGRHLVATNDQVKQFAEINPIDSMMHRSVDRNDLGDGKRIFTSEFSIPSALQVVTPLTALIRSDQKQARKLTGSVLKTCAVLTQIGSPIPFEYHVAPKMVALK